MDPASRASSGDRLRLWQLLCFASGALAPQALVMALTIHVPRHFASQVGLGLAAVGTAFTVVRLIDIAFDPAIGAVMDRTKTLLGRYRFWMLAGAPILMGSAYMLFMASPGADAGYLILWLLVFYSGVSIVQLAHAAWAGTLSGSYHERSRIFGYIGAAGLFGSALVMLIPAIASRWIGDDDIAGLQAMGWTMILLVPVLTLVSAQTGEKLRPAPPQTRVPAGEYLSLIWRPSMRRIILADLALALGPGTLTPIFVFYWRDARDFTLAQANLMLVMFMFGGLVGAPVWGWLAQRIGKHRTIILTSLCFALGQVVVVSLPGRSPAVFPMMWALGFFVSAFTLLVRAIVADISDEVRLDFGRERSGLLFALVTSTQKIGGAVSVALTFWLLAWLGYDPVAGSAAEGNNVSGLEALYALAPITFVLVGALAFWRFPLDARRHAEIRKKLETPEADSSEAPAGGAPHVAVGRNDPLSAPGA